MIGRCCIHSFLIAMLLFAGSDLSAQSVAHDRCQSLGKGMNVSNWLEEYWNADWPNPTKYTKQHFEAMHLAGIESVRLPINFHAVVDTITPYAVDTGHLVFDLVDSVITWTDELDMKLLIDNHHGWFLDDDTWRTELPRFSHMWAVVANKYKHLDPDRVIFELLNEPLLGFHRDSLVIMYKDAIDSIRVYTTDHSIVLSPQWAGTAMMFSEFEPIEGDTNLIYTWHTYDPLNFTHQGLTWHNPYFPSGTEFPSADTTITETWFYTGWERVLDWKETYGLPMFLGEFGLSNHCDSVSVCNWLEYSMTRVVQNDFSWFYWDWQWDFSMFRSHVISEDSIYPCYKYYLGLYGDDTFTDLPMPRTEPEWSVYPNPSVDGLFQLEVSGRKGLQQEVRIYTNRGRLVFEDEFAGSSYSSNRKLKPGIYVVGLRNEQGSAIKKLVVSN